MLAGNEIANALQAFEATGKKIKITVGALAASMAAIIVSNAKAENVRVHQNTRLMFHGASVITKGGAGAHEDSAALLESINQQVIDKLVAKNPEKAEEINGWFSEGRAGWLTAQQAVAMGLAGSVIGEDADKAPKVSKEAAQAMLDNGGIDIAAFDCEPPNGSNEAVADTTEAKNTTDASVPLADFEQMKARFAGMQSAKDKEIAALKAAFAEKETALISESALCKKQLSDLTAETELLKADIEKAKADLITAKGDAEKAMTDLAAECELRKQAEARHAALVGGVLRRDDGDADNLTWPEVSQRLGYAEAKKRYPELCQQYNDNAKSKGKSK